MSWLGWLNTNAGAVQAVATVILVGVTVAYVFITRNLAHAPHMAYIRPIDIKPNAGSFWEIKMHNYGPGVATGIRIKTIVWTVIEHASRQRRKEVARPPSQDAF